MLIMMTWFIVEKILKRFGLLKVWNNIYVDAGSLLNSAQHGQPLWQEANYVQEKSVQL